jgi:hypothetical protein
MAENDTNGAANKQQQQGKDDKGDDGQTGDGEPKVYTDEQVQKIVQKRVKGLSVKNTELESRLKALEEGSKKEPEPKIVDDSEMSTLKKELAALKDENSKTKAERDSAALQAKKVKLCKGRGLPRWFDPTTMLPGTTDEEIEDAIDNILKDMEATEKEETERRKKQGFGGPTPRTKGVKPTADDIMNDALLGSLGRRRLR